MPAIGDDDHEVKLIKPASEDMEDEEEKIEFLKGD